MNTIFVYNKNKPKYVSYGHKRNYTINADQEGRGKESSETVVPMVQWDNTVEQHPAGYVQSLRAIGHSEGWALEFEAKTKEQL